MKRRVRMVADMICRKVGRGCNLGKRFGEFDWQVGSSALHASKLLTDTA